MSINPFPTLTTSDEGGKKSVDGLIFDSPKYCKENCDKEGCTKEYSNLSFENGTPSFKICHKGFIICSFSIYDKRHIIHGLVVPESKEKNKKIFNKRFISTHYVNKEKIEKFIHSYSNLDKSYHKKISSMIAQVISPYHDIKRLIGAIVSNLELYAKKTHPDNDLTPKNWTIQNLTLC